MLERALLDAAWEELRENGFHAMTMAGVAARAGAAKSVVYRRWPDKAAVVHAVVRDRVPRLGRVEITGELRRDALAVLEQLSATLRGLCLVDDTDPVLAQRLRRAAGDEAVALLTDAVTAYGCDAATVGRHVIRVPVDLLAHAPADEQTPTLDQLVDDIFLPLVDRHRG